MPDLRALPLLCLLTTFLAGCSDGGGQTQDDGALVSEEDFEGLDATEDTGVIRGVVVDEAVRPIAGAVISIKSIGQNATSAESGAFGFAGLATGTYFLEVGKTGYKSIQVSADVVAGEAQPAITKVLLVADPEMRPFFELVSFEGYLQCSVRFVVNALAACSVLPQSGDDPFVRLHPTVVPTFAQSEMIWESTQALGDGLKLQYTDDSDGGLDNYVVAVGGSPLIISANETLMEEKNVGDEDVGLYIRVFSGSVDGTKPPVCPPSGPCDGVSVVVNQSFHIYTVLFYNMLPPEGWTFGEHGEPPQP